MPRFGPVAFCGRAFEKSDSGGYTKLDDGWPESEKDVFGDGASQATALL